MEALRGIHYNLLMIDVPLSCCSFLYGDNISVIHNTQRPELTLMNELGSIFYHYVRKSVAMVETNTVHISKHDNGSDHLTKVLYGSKRNKFVGNVCMTFMIDLFCLKGLIHSIKIKL